MKLARSAQVAIASAIIVAGGLSGTDFAVASISHRTPDPIPVPGAEMPVHARPGKPTPAGRNDS
ncbi:hypothetical protein, partial [Streptomyces chartreusis]|uniref:hypothetical protein n=1 Tax=Streptomyces chartreusis TaxID=1969 RepID=UPI003801DDF0